MSKLQKNREEKLRQKRERERERRRKIREDPIKKQEQKEKEHRKYLRQRQNKIRQSITELSERDKRQKRKSWKVYSRNYRQRKKAEQQQLQYLDRNTPPVSDDDNIHPELPHLDRQDGRRTSNKIRSQKNRIKRHKEKLKLIEKIKRLKSEAAKYKKRYQRLKNEKQQSRGPLTPSTKANIIIQAAKSEKDKTKVEEVKKQILVEEVIKEQLANT